MNGKFLLYGILVTMLSTGVSWGKLLSSASNDSSSSGSRGSSWYSGTSGSRSGSGSHK